MRSALQVIGSALLALLVCGATTAQGLVELYRKLAREGSAA